jgi:hypothetical protein
MVEYSRFSWEPSLQELVAAGIQLIEFTYLQFSHLFKMKSISPIVYVRQGDIAVGLYVEAIIDSSVVIASLKKANIDFVER